MKITNQDSVIEHVPRRVFDLQHAKILLFGRPTDWRGETKTFSLWPIVERYGAKRLFLADPAMCDAVIARPGVDTPEKLAEKTGAPFPFFSGCAEGVVLERNGDASILKTADCPTIVVMGPQGLVTVGHGALNALVDRKVIHNDPGKKRSSPGVINSIIECFKKMEVNIAGLSVFVTLGICARHFEHPLDHPNPAYQLMNRELVAFLEREHPASIVGEKQRGRIDLFQLIADLCVKAGVRRNNITCDHYDSWADQDEENKFLWWSNRRDGPGQGRNAVVVIKH